MGVDTKGMVSSSVTALDIANAVKSLYRITPIIHDTSIENYSLLCFTYKDEKRQLSLFEKYDDLEDVSEICTLLSFGMWGNSVEIMRDIVGTFGGMIMKNDCDGSWESVPKNDGARIDAWVVNRELTEKLRAAEFSTQEIIKFADFIKSNASYIKTLELE